MRKKRATKKPMRRRAAKPRVRRPMRGTIADYASCSVASTIVPRGGGNFATNIMYSSFQNGGIKLSDFPRAAAIAANYQHFRIKQVKLTIKLAYDTYQVGNAIPGGSSRPNIYYMIDKSGAIPLNVTLEGLKQMGAKPKAGDNKPFVITWRPAVLTEDLNGVGGGAVASQYRISPWLATNPGGANVFNPSNVAHNGLYWYVDSLFGGGIQYNCELEVQFAFKKPLYGGVTSSTVPTGFELATANSSPIVS